MRIKAKHILLASLLAVLLASGCLSSDLTVIEDGTALDPAYCLSSGLSSQVTVFHSLNCGACKLTVPILAEIERETDVRFEFIDVSADRQRMYDLGIAPSHVPTVIINCRAYTGYKTKDEFMGLIF